MDWHLPIDMVPGRTHSRGTHEDSRRMSTSEAVSAKTVRVVPLGRRVLDRMPDASGRRREAPLSGTILLPLPRIT